MAGKQQNTQVLVCLPVTYVPGGTIGKVETLGLQTPVTSGHGSGQRTSKRSRIIHHGADELLKLQDSVPDREIPLPFQETQHTHLLRSPLPHLIDMK